MFSFKAFSWTNLSELKRTLEKEGSSQRNTEPNLQYNTCGFGSTIKRFEKL